MTKLIVVSAAETDWAAQGRLVGDTDLPLNEAGHRQAIADGQALVERAPDAVYSGPEEATRETGELIAHELNAKLKKVKTLRELDLGHWEGLSEQDFRERFAKVYKQWRSDPLSVSPPEGESLVDAAERLAGAIDKLIRQHPQKTLVVILGRFAAAIIRCRFDDGDYARFWDHVDGARERRLIETSGGDGKDASSSDSPTRE